MENVPAKVGEKGQANGYETDSTAVETHRRLGVAKRASTRECLVPPLQELSPPPCEYTVGGENGTGGITYRSPSPLNFFRSESRNVAHPLSLNESCSSLGSSYVGRWGKKEVAEWLESIGLGDYLAAFEEHAVLSGKILVQLTEEHLKEMGVKKVGHRLILLSGLNELRMKHVRIGVVPGEEMTQSQQSYPKRIILIRHGESQGNVDQARYSYMPDNKLELTPLGRRQAFDAGSKLKELIGSETVGFYISPFIRSQQTFVEIRKFFLDDQVLYQREDPRIREQEWGNFQDPNEMPRMMRERRSIGAFFYRFPTGESGADVYDRVSMFLESLYRDMEKGRCGQNAIIVSHGLFCRLFLTRFYHWKIEFFHRLWNFDNCQFAVMALQSEGHYKLVSKLRADPPNS